MNSFKVLIGLCAVLAIGIGCRPCAADVHEDLMNLAEQEGDTVFNEDQDGYDKHADIFYYQDKLVDQEYSRKSYLATQVTMAGQKPDPTLRAVKPAVYPFGVAQRSFKPFGTIMDRWDVKDTGNEVQFLALYHGHGGTFVVNKLRAHLLRELANTVTDMLPTLDRLAEDDAQDLESERDLVLDTLRGAIERVFRNVDIEIRKQMSIYDDTTATATVVIISKSHIITVAVGEGKVVGYDENFETSVLADFLDDPTAFNIFGAKKSRNTLIFPHVDFHKRDETNYQFLLLLTPSVARYVDKEQATRIVTSEIDQHKDVESEEQEIYSGSLVRILNIIESTVPKMERTFKHSDHSLMLVGLNTDYENIH